MKQHPTLFKPFMQHQIRTGGKSVTRRVITESNSHCVSYLHSLDFSDAIKDCFLLGPKTGYLKVAKPDDETRWRVTPKWTDGDRLWVKEKWMRNWDGMEEGVDLFDEDGDPLPEYCTYSEMPEVWDDTHRDDYRWKSPLFMPKAAARLWLEVVSVRPERLQELTAADAVLEGVSFDKDSGYWFAEDEIMADNAQCCFIKLWDSINAKPKRVKTNPHTGVKEECYVSYPWSDVQYEDTLHNLTHYIIGNPWVLRIEFKKL